MGLTRRASGVVRATQHCVAGSDPGGGLNALFEAEFVGGIQKLIYHRRNPFITAFPERLELIWKRAVLRL